MFYLLLLVIDLFMTSIGILSPVYMTKETLKSNGMVKGGYLKDCKKF